MEDNSKTKDIMNNSDEMFWGIKRSPLQVKLIKKLRQISTDPEFILSVITDAQHDDDARYMIEYINRGEDVTYSQLILQAMHLSMVRSGEINN